MIVHLWVFEYKDCELEVYTCIASTILWPLNAHVLVVLSLAVLKTLAYFSKPLPLAQKRFQTVS